MPTADGESTWLGLDLGTTGCRVAAVSGTGTLLASATAPLTSRYPRAGWHEQDPAAWFTATTASCRQVVAALGDRSRTIAGLAVCGTSGTLVLGDGFGHPLTPALMYDDARAVGAERTAQLIETWQACCTRNGYQVQATWALAKLGWLLDNVAGARSAKLYHCADLLGTWFTGHRVAADTSHVLKSGYDLVAMAWPTEELEAAAVPAEMLPNVVLPGTVVGTVGEQAAAQTGIAVGTPVIAGMTDGCASQVASGAVDRGQWNIAVGTTFVLKGVSDELLHGDALYSHRHPDGGWLPGGASSAGGGAITAEFPHVDFQAMDRAAATYLPTSVVRYPLSRPGERFPFVRPDAEPFRLGDPHDDAEAFAALQQGVALVERLSLDYVASLGGTVKGQLTLTGGATRSANWNQLQADVLGRPLTLPRHPDAAFGMAVLAASAGDSVVGAAGRMVGSREMIEPRREPASAYLNAYGRLVEELERRGYIHSELADAARSGR